MMNLFQADCSYKNITGNLGILPIKLGPTELKTTNHTFEHYFKQIYEEYRNLNFQNAKIVRSCNYSFYKNDIYNYRNLIVTNN